MLLNCKAGLAELQYAETAIGFVETVREIFRRLSGAGFGPAPDGGSEPPRHPLQDPVARSGNRSGGKPFFRGALYELLSNPIYSGEIRHKGVRHPGLHEPIVDRELRDSTQLLLRSHAARRAPRARKSAASPLTGKIFDDSGQSLTPSHAVKGEWRYRYYVSRGLSKGTADASGCGWRLPAPEIERTVAASACQILSDRIGIAAAAVGLAQNRLPAIFAAADGWSARLQSEVEAGAALNAVVDRVDLSDTGIRVSLKLPIPEPAARLATDANQLIITRFFPMTIRRREVEMRLVIAGNCVPAARADSALLKAVARARQWSEDPLAGRAQSVAEIAEREHVGSRYVSCAWRSWLRKLSRRLP